TRKGVNPHRKIIKNQIHPRLFGRDGKRADRDDAEGTWVGIIEETIEKHFAEDVGTFHCRDRKFQSESEPSRMPKGTFIVEIESSSRSQSQAGCQRESLPF